MSGQKKLQCRDIHLRSGLILQSRHQSDTAVYMNTQSSSGGLCAGLSGLAFLYFSNWVPLIAPSWVVFHS